MTVQKPVPFASVPESTLKRIRGVCFDIDDTFSSHGKITSPAFESLWRLKNVGYLLVPVTGRPAGWCDHIARFWPVDAVVGENGAFIYYLDGEKRRRSMLPPGADLNAASKKAALQAKILAKFPHAKFASDQLFRENDLAIDICEDVPAWPSADVDALLALCESEGAVAKLSSIHVNTWYGDFNKRKGLEHWFASQMPGVARPVPFVNEEWIYLGDSPNDEPMFDFFRHSVGVKNVEPYLERMKHPPKYIAEFESGDGFKSVADRLLEL